MLRAQIVFSSVHRWYLACVHEEFLLACTDGEYMKNFALLNEGSVCAKIPCMERNTQKKHAHTKDFFIGIGTMILAIVSFLLVCQLLVVIVKLIIG